MITLSKEDSGHWLWFLQRVSGVLLVVTLVIHFGVEHFTTYSTGDAYTYARVIARLSNNWFKLLDMSFLTLGIFHGFHGLWMVGRDYLHSQGLRLLLAGVLISAALILFTWGAVTVIPPLPVPPSAGLTGAIR